MATWNAAISDPNTTIFTDLEWLGHLCNALNQRKIGPDLPLMSQIITITGAPTGGTFTLTFGAATTTPIAFNAPAVAIQMALDTLGYPLAGDVIVSGYASDGYIINFLGVYGRATSPLFTATSSLTGGISPGVTIRYNGISIVGGVNTWDVQTGDDVQDSGFWSGVQCAISGIPGGGIDGALQYETTDLPGWVRTDTPVDPTTGPIHWSESGLRTYLGLTVALNRDGSDSGGPYWRRKKPRTVVSVSATGTVDDDGNTLAAGMIAWVAGYTLSSTETQKLKYQSATNEVQTITISGSPTAGTFLLYDYSGDTSTLAFNAAASDIQTALEGLTDIGSGNVTVSGSNPYTVTFVGALANTHVPLLGASSFLTGGTNPAVTVAQTTLGGPWIPAAYSDSPDVLDSNNAHTGNAYTLPGLMLAGDYMGPHILLEIRAMLNQLVWHLDYPLLPGNTTTTGFAACADLTNATLEAASAAAADANYSAATPVTNAVPVGFGAVKAFDPGLFGANIVVDSGALSMPNVFASTLAYTVDFYVYPIAALPGDVIPTYDAQGISFLAENEWCFWQTKGPSTGPLVSDTWPQSSPPPNWPAPLPNQNAQGYYIPSISEGINNPTLGGDNFILSVSKYDVTGGFTEQASSP